MASSACRQPSPGSLRLDLGQLQTTRLTENRIARDLEALCEMGFLEAFRDENNIVRYKPVQQA
jgi:hypothetical protein